MFVLKRDWAAYVVLVMAIGVLAYIGWNLIQGLNALSGLAIWIQAAGSMLAVFAAYQIGRAQAEAREKEIVEAHRQLAGSIDAAAEEAVCKIIMTAQKLPKGPCARQSFYGIYNGSNMKVISNIINSVPIHEIGNYRLAKEVIGVSICLSELQSEMENVDRRFAESRDTPAVDIADLRPIANRAAGARQRIVSEVSRYEIEPQLLSWRKNVEGPYLQMLESAKNAVVPK